MNSFVLWCIAIVFYLATLGAFSFNPISATGYLIIALISTPPFKKKIEQELKIQYNKKAITIIVILSFFLPIVFPYDAQQKAAQKENQKREEEAADELQKDKTKILADIDSAIAQKDFSTALRISEKYLSTQDADLLNRYTQAKTEETKKNNKIRTDELMLQLKSTSDSNFLEKEKIYRELSTINPDNKEYSTKADEYAQKAAQEKERKQKQALSKLRKDVDDVEGITWYSHVNAPKHNNANGFQLYFGQSESGKHPLRLKVQYYGDDWLFIHSFLVVADGQRFEVNNVHFKRDNYTEIWEWYDQPMTEKDRAMIEAVINSKKATIRFQGQQYYDDRSISAKQKQALKDMLLAYESL